MGSWHSAFILTFGGVAIFMFGMHIAGDNLQKLAADRIRDIVTTLAKKPIWGMFLGVGLTMILQSSGAVTSLLVGLGSAGVVTIHQVMTVILGTAVGSTLTVQVLSFNVAEYGLPLFALSYFAYFLSKKRTVKNAAGAAMGFGLLFFGFELIHFGTEMFREMDHFQDVIHTISENPLYLMLLTAFFTAVCQSSAVTILLGMTLAQNGLIQVEDAVYLLFGANIGTTATALIASTNGNYVGRQVAWAHTLYKIAGVILFFPFAHLMAKYLSFGSPAHDVANINTFYNLAAALIFFPFAKRGAKLVENMFPPSREEREYSVRYLKKADWESPSVSLAHAEREALRMADVVMGMIDDSLKLFRKDDPDAIQAMRRRDDRADLLARELNLYLAQQLDQAPEGVRKQMLRLMYFVTDLEAAADVVDNQLIELAQKKHHLKVNFSEEGWRDLEEIAKAVQQISQMSIACFQTQDKDLAAKVIFHKRNVRRLEQKMRESHVTRLVKGTPESIVTSSIHLDVLGEYRRIVGLMANHVYSLMKDGDPYGLLPRRE